MTDIARDWIPSKRGEHFNQHVLKEIADKLASVKFGEILIKVHNSRIIQVEKTEKFRYDQHLNAVEQGEGI